eukprot:6027978-Prymnesium_polylepis.1
MATGEFVAPLLECVGGTCRAAQNAHLRPKYQSQHSHAQGAHSAQVAHFCFAPAHALSVPPPAGMRTQQRCGRPAGWASPPSPTCRSRRDAPLGSPPPVRRSSRRSCGSTQTDRSCWRSSTSRRATSCASACSNSAPRASPRHACAQKRTARDVSEGGRCIGVQAHVPRSEHREADALGVRVCLAASNWTRSRRIEAVVHGAHYAATVVGTNTMHSLELAMQHTHQQVPRAPYSALRGSLRSPHAQLSSRLDAHSPTSTLYLSPPFLPPKLPVGPQCRRRPSCSPPPSTVSPPSQCAAPRRAR